MKKYLQLIILFTLLVSIAFSQTNSKDNLSVERLKSDNLLLTSKIQTLEAKYDLLKAEIENLKLIISGIQKQTPTATQPAKVEPPAQSNSSPSAPVQQSVVPKHATNGGQCMATTKAGKRCSRSARTNGYCWQHGG